MTARRRVHGLALAALLAAAACGRSEESVSAPTAEPERAALAAAPPPPPALALQLDGVAHEEVLEGTPLVFTVSLSAAEDAPAVHVEGWVTQLRLVDAETDAALAWQTTPLGEARVWIFAEGAEPDAKAEAIDATLEPGHIYEAELGIAPVAAAGIPPGRHELRVGLDVPGLPGPARSEPVTLVVRAAAEATPELERVRRLATLRFALRAGSSEEAERLARELVAQEPAALESHLLLGEALQQQGREAEAAAAYREALARAPARGRHEEAPDLLLQRIDALEASR